ncbi:hypothetical protein [Streptomyces sp. Inha503]|uniref:hypothetical protein n=1 Tax=Streptomyces sp. Inha503 TaxID=3383314 RepID=UPI00399F8C68
MYSLVTSWCPQPEDDAPEAEQTAAKHAALEARTVVGEALTELQLLTDDPRVLSLAARVVDVTFTLHEAPDRADRDRRGDLARTAHNAFVAAAGPLVRAWERAGAGVPAVRPGNAGPD